MVSFLCVVLAVLELDYADLQLKRSTCLCQPNAGIEGIRTMPGLNPSSPQSPGG